MVEPATSQIKLSAATSAGDTKALLVLFFFSGFPALIYELVWQRALFRIFGVNIESVTVTVTAFMIGLGLGSIVGGFISRKQSIPPLLILALIESATAVFGYFSLSLFEMVGTLVLARPLAVTAAVTLALVLAPCLLMGATLPILVRHFVQGSACVGESVGQLYYVNTLGAGMVCLIAAVLMFPFLGMQKAVDIAVVINVAVASCALLTLLRQSGHRLELKEGWKHESSSANPLLGVPTMLLLAYCGGLVSLSYEIFFFHTVAYATGNSAPAFACTLGAFLVGLASGSRTAAENCHGDSALLVRRTLRCVFSANIIGIAFLPVLSHLDFLRNGILSVALLMVYVVARYWGALLPSLAQLSIRADDQAGLRMAWLCLANILGAATGSVLTGFVLMNTWGLLELAQNLVLAGLSCGVLLASALPMPRREKLLYLGGAISVGVLTWGLMPALARHPLESLLWKGAQDSSIPFEHVVENRSGILAVDRSGAIYGNGIYDGMFNTSLKNDHNGVLRPYALSYYNASPRRVLQIGLASGSWAQIIANNPEVQSLTIIEINPGYLGLIAEQPEVASLLRNPKVTIFIDDGRRWLRLHPQEKFDAIVSNTTYNFRGNATNLLSVEFLELIKRHLKPNGSFFYNTTGSRRVLRTGCAVFPYGARFSNHLLVSMVPLRWDVQRWKRNLVSYRIDGRPVLDLRQAEDRAFLEKLDTVAQISYIAPGKLIEPCAEILRSTNGLELITDDNMGTEWRHFLGLE